MSKIILITGASRGIGAETARLAAAAGYSLCLNYVSNRKAAEAVLDCSAFAEAPPVRPEPQESPPRSAQAPKPGEAGPEPSRRPVPAAMRVPAR